MQHDEEFEKTEKALLAAHAAIYSLEISAGKHAYEFGAKEGVARHRRHLRADGDLSGGGDGTGRTDSLGILPADVPKTLAGTGAAPHRRGPGAPERDRAPSPLLRGLSLRDII